MARTIIICGQDDITPIEQAALLHSQIAGSEIAMIENCGHVPWIDQPSVLRRLLRSFLTA